MRIIFYNLFLLIFFLLFAGFLMSAPMATMSMTEGVTIAIVLGLYVVAMSFIGEGKVVDERGMLHRHLANRWALVAGTVVLTLGVVYQLFVSHELDYWLLSTLIAINVVKILGLIYSEYRR